MISQPAVPETALKRRKRDEAWAAKKATADAEAAAASKKNSEEIFKRAEKYVKEYRDQVRFGETRRARVTQTHRFSRHRRDAARPLRDASGQTREATDVGARRVIRAKPRSRGGRGGGRPRPPASPPERSERSRWRFRALWRWRTHRRSLVRRAPPPRARPRGGRIPRVRAVGRLKRRVTRVRRLLSLAPRPTADPSRPARPSKNRRLIWCA